MYINKKKLKKAIVLSLMVSCAGGIMPNAFLGMNTAFAGNVVVDSDTSSPSNQKNSISADVSDSGIIGAGNTVSSTTKSSITGMQNTVSGLTEVGIEGSYNTLTNINASLICGDHVTMSNSTAVSVIGGLNTVSDSSASSLTGLECTMSGTTYSSINGYKSKTENTTEAGILGRNDTISGGSQNAIIGSYNTLTDSKQTFVAGFSNTLGSNLTGDQILGSNVTVAEGVSNSVILGTSTNVSASNAVAIGNTATVSGENSIAIGSNSTASTANSVALGANSVTSSAHTGSTAQSITLKGTTYTFAGQASDTAGTVSVGSAGNERQIQNVAAGDISATSTDAVNGSQLYAVAQSVGSDITNINNEINKLGDRVDKVGAGAAALAALHPLDFDPDDKWDFALGYGHYDGQGAVATGMFYRPNEDTMFSIGYEAGNGENMWNAGVTLKLGSGNHVSTSRVAMAKEIVDLRSQNTIMQKEIQQLNDRLNAVLGTIDTAKSAEFPDVPENHWAYEYVAKLAGNGIIKGYPDGTFQGDRTMTRYEFAAMLYRAMQNGAAIDSQLLAEFKPELDRIKVDTVSSKSDGTPTIQRVRVIPGRG